ncbi:MAG TPA: hypothetical protein VMU69_05425, partial [Bradyrhizobium sp.]|nr:hypothetical protein [Bradyrhizobium sp.]
MTTTAATMPVVIFKALIVAFHIAQTTSAPAMRTQGVCDNSILSRNARMAGKNKPASLPTYVS